MQHCTEWVQTIRLRLPIAVAHSILQKVPGWVWLGLAVKFVVVVFAFVATGPGVGGVGKRSHPLVLRA